MQPTKSEAQSQLAGNSAGTTTHTLVFTFKNDIVSGSTAVTSGVAASANTIRNGKP
ncbi:MAG: hypothetical protein M3032_12365 [Verrucomicrobiota bacterium]|nr:hypothetical protein [Verrucomicrobiota bacterium]